MSTKNQGRYSRFLRGHLVTTRGSAQHSLELSSPSINGLALHEFSQLIGQSAPGVPEVMNSPVLNSLPRQCHIGKSIFFTFHHHHFIYHYLNPWGCRGGGLPSMGYIVCATEQGMVFEVFSTFLNRLLFFFVLASCSQRRPYQVTQIVSAKLQFVNASLNEKERFFSNLKQLELPVKV